MLLVVGKALAKPLFGVGRPWQTKLGGRLQLEWWRLCPATSQCGVGRSLLAKPVLHEEDVLRALQSRLGFGKPRHQWLSVGVKSQGVVATPQLRRRQLWLANHLAVAARDSLLDVEKLWHSSPRGQASGTGASPQS